jgi:hypothetical protein
LSGIGLVRQVDASANARNRGNKVAFKGLLATALIEQVIFNLLYLAENQGPETKLS